MSKKELNIHQLIQNSIFRHKLSFYIPKDTLYSMLRRKSTPEYETVAKIAQGMREALEDTRTQSELEIWLVDESKP